ncbi:MAG: hypothetical protein R3A13_12810 [Bdellovibrionota bacterium]
MKKRKAAKAEGKPFKRISAEAHLKHFSYLDQGLTPGVEYLYKILPINQDDVEGEVRQIIKVIYKGDASTVVMMSNSEFLAEEDFFNN